MTAVEVAQLALQDRIVAVLREADRPLPTVEVCSRAGWVLEARTCWPERHKLDRGPGWFLLACYPQHGVDLVGFRVSTPIVLPIVYRLESLGLVRRLGGGGRAVRWVATIRNPDARAVAAIEESWRVTG